MSAALFLTFSPARARKLSTFTGGPRELAQAASGRLPPMNSETFARLSAHQPELAARLGDFHISFTIAGRVFSHTLRHTTANAAYATMDRMVEEAEALAAKGPSKGRGLAYNCAVRKLEDPEVRAQMAIARGNGAARRASGWS